MKYRLINYFDVWGNKDEGFEVNNLCIEEENLYISDDSTDKEIATFLKNIGFLATDDLRKINIVNWGDMIEIESKGHYPIGRLEQQY